jgi:hypothetical protein
MITKEQYNEAVNTIKAWNLQCMDGIKNFDQPKEIVDLKDKYLIGFVNSRVFNVLKIWFFRGNNINDIKINQLQTVSKKAIKKADGIGKKSMLELDELCKKANIQMLP